MCKSLSKSVKVHQSESKCNEMSVKLAFLEKLKLYFLIKILFWLYKICHLILTLHDQVWYSTMCMGASMNACQTYLIGGVGFVAYSVANCTCGNACKSAWEEGNDVHEQKEKHKKISHKHTLRKKTG